MRNLITLLATVALVFLAACQTAPPQPPEEGMVRLFDGKSLDNFTVKNGTATYKVENGMIVGTTKAGSPNTFLCTKRDYGDFILVFDVLDDPELNSGVQIRSHQYPADTTVMTLGNNGPVERKHKAGRVHGLQVEISNAETGTSGGIYDEAGRGWVDNIVKDPEASKAFKDKQWNHYRVEAIGDSIKVSVNGVPCANLVDSVNLTGFIGFQVHQYKGDTPKQVRWKNIWIKDLGEHTWQPLFDGRTLNGWTPTGDAKWKVVDGAIEGTGRRSGKGGLLLSDAGYDDITVRLQFKDVKGNSGFFFRTEQTPKGLQGLEAEIDEKEAIGGYYEVGGRKYVVKPSDEEVARFFKPGDWNSMTVSAHGRRLVFHVNNYKTVDLPNDPCRLSGKLGLQVHGKQNVEVWFKSIERLVKK